MATFSKGMCTEINDPFIQGFLQGLAPALLEINSYSDTYDNAVRTFYMRRDRANTIAGEMERQFANIKNKIHIQAMKDLMKAILAAPQNPNWDGRPPVEVLEIQKEVFTQVGEDFIFVSRHVLTNTTITKEMELGFLKGLQLSILILTDSYKGFGGLDYKIKTLRMQQNSIKRIVEAIQKKLKSIKNKSLENAVRKLLGRMLIVSKAGSFASTDYWTSKKLQFHRKALDDIRIEIDGLVSKAKLRRSRLPRNCKEIGEFIY